MVTTLVEAYPELRSLYFLIKAFLVNKNAHKPWKGGIGSFVLINLITVYLQLTHAKKLAKATEESSEVGMHGLAIGFLSFIG